MRISDWSSDVCSSDLNADSASVQKLFGSSSGIAAQLNGAIDRIIGNDGLVEARDDALKTQLDGLDSQFDALNARMAKVEARYQAPFNALATLISSLQNHSPFLTSKLKQSVAIGSSSNQK